jgi:hypothetical protein
MSTSNEGNRAGTYWPVGIAMLCAALPLLSAFATYLLSASLGQVAWCWPMLEGCTSISRAARSEPAIFIFRLLMLPTAILLVFCWALVCSWLQQHGSRRAQTRSILIAGVVGAIALAFYVDFLGSGGEFYQFMRRFGITFHFAGTGLAQLLTVRLLRQQQTVQSLEKQVLEKKVSEKSASEKQTAAHNWLWYLVIGQLLLAILHVSLKAGLADYDSWENRLEWSLAVLMALWFAVLAKLFWQDQFRVTATLR